MTRSVRSFLKGLLERSLVALGGPRLIRAVRSGEDVILAYHNVVPEGERPGGDRSLHLPRSVFARQLDLLVDTHRVVDLSTLIEADAEVPGPPLAAITIDDGYRGALTVGLDELEARGLPCTVFVPPALLGATDLWWDNLASESGVLPAHLRETALTRFRGRQEEVEGWVEVHGIPRHRQPEHAGIVDEEEFVQVAAREQVSVGSHGWTHANLTRLEGRELREELTRPLAWLGERYTDALVRWLSLPYGLWNDEVVSAACELGYRGVLDLSGKLVERGSAAGRARVPRKNIPSGVSPEGFRLRLSGL